MRRMGTPDEIAAAALFLASDESSFITGQWLSPNGGIFIGTCSVRLAARAFGAAASKETPMLSSWDDYPVHQIADTIRHVGTSDRNFYDRYYFNLHGSSDELFMVMGLGQYPNLARAGRVRVRVARRAPPRGARVARARRSHGHERRAVPRRGREAARLACASSSSRTSTGSPATSPGTARSPRSRSRASTSASTAACCSTRCASRRRAAGAARSRSAASGSP